MNRELHITIRQARESYRRYCAGMKRGEIPSITVTRNSKISPYRTKKPKKAKGFVKIKRTTISTYMANLNILISLGYTPKISKNRSNRIIRIVERTALKFDKSGGTCKSRREAMFRKRKRKITKQTK